MPESDDTKPNPRPVTITIELDRTTVALLGIAADLYYEFRRSFERAKSVKRSSPKRKRGKP